LNFNWKLVLMPPEVLDYVVVHELAHRREMNHSVRFWKVVEAELPDYQARRALLRQYERRLMTEAEV
jgi:predicted metal-dependent hydrolase